MQVIAMLKNINTTFNKILFSFAGVSLVLSMCLIVGNGVIRMYAKPFGATVEVVSWCAAIATAFSLGSTQIAKGNVSIDIFTNKLPLPIQKVIEFILYLISSLFFGVVALQLIRYALSLKESGTLSETLSLPIYPIIMIISLGFISLIFTLVIQTIELLFKKEGKAEWIQE